MLGYHRSRMLSISLATLVAATAASGLATASSPEPSATAGWTYLALGDSNVYGPAEACGDCTSYPHLLAERITDELGVPVRLLDGSQWNRLTSRRLLEEIQADAWGEDWEQPRDPSLSPRAAIAVADLITITVAANDQPWSADPDPCAGVYDEACIEQVVGAYRANLDDILGEIDTIRAGRPTGVLVTTLYNDMIAGPGHDPTWFYPPDFLASSAADAAGFIDALNGAIVDMAAAHGATVVDMHAVGNGPDGTEALPAGWFSRDYGDLNQAGQEAFAAEMMRVGFDPLDVGGAGMRGAVASPPSLSAAGLPAFAPDAPLVLTQRPADEGGGIFVLYADGSGLQQLATDLPPGSFDRAEWSPDGQQVVFVDHATDRLWIAHLDGSPTTAVPTCDSPAPYTDPPLPGCDFPAWSPDGTRIAFSRYEGADGWALPGPAAVGIRVVDLATGEVTPVVRLERPLLADVPRWSPHGTHIVFGVDQMDDEANETGAAIAIVPATGGEPVYLTAFEAFAYNPDWGWVTDEIVYDDDWAPGDTSNVFGIRPDGSGSRQITNAGPGETIRGARWTPDGSGLTAYDSAFSGALIDPASGHVTPFATTGSWKRPLVRPRP